METVIKQPMDLGTMTKKLKTLTYKSKADFVADLDLIWGNCLKYNGDLNHPLRRNANSMRKEAEKLVPLIPDLVIRPRAEVEAEERRKQNGGEDDAGEDSDDEPIMSSRGRVANKGSTKSRTNASGREEGTPCLDIKPTLQLNGLLAREGSETGMEGSNGFSTPPVGAPGSITPIGIHGTLGSQSDGLDIDGPSINGLALGQALADDLQEDEEYKIWKQVTKKDRALVAKERHRIFKGDQLNVEQPAPLRSKAGMRSWLRQQKQAHDTSRSDTTGAVKTTTQETLAEGMEGEEERALPDYYDYMSAVPDVPKRLQWVEDDEGNVLDRRDECLRLVPPGIFTAPESALTAKFEANMKQIQETRKVCSKIGVIKQMQLQAQVCLEWQRLLVISDQCLDV
jgi:transcriptional activator SPT7